MGRNLNGSKLYGDVTASTSGLAIGQPNQPFQRAYTNQIIGDKVLYLQNWTIDNSGLVSLANTSGYDKVFQIGSGNTVNPNQNFSLAVGGSNISNNLVSVALGFSNQATNQYATALGNFSVANAIQSIAIGCVSQAKGDNSVSVGVFTNISTGSTNSYLFGGFSATLTGVINTMVLGGGFGTSNPQKLIANISNSIFIGINSTVPSLFVGGGNGTAGSMGNIGVNLTNPTARLDILANSSTNSSLRIRVGVSDPSVAYDGDIWYNGRLKHRVGTTNQTIAYMSDIISASTSGAGPGSAYISTYNITGNNVDTLFTINHTKNTRNVLVQVFQNGGSYDNVLVDVVRPTVNTVNIIFNTAPTNAENFTILII